MANDSLSIFSPPHHSVGRKKKKRKNFPPCSSECRALDHSLPSLNILLIHFQKESVWHAQFLHMLISMYIHRYSQTLILFIFLLSYFYNFSHNFPLSSKDIIYKNSYREHSDLFSGSNYQKKREVVKKKE